MSTRNGMAGYRLSLPGEMGFSLVEWKPERHLQGVAEEHKFSNRRSFRTIKMSDDEEDRLEIKY